MTFVATMGNPGAAAAAFAAFNVTDTVVSGVQAIASGANVGLVLGSIGLSIGLNILTPGADYASGNLLKQVGVHAIRGAAISTATTAAITGGRGNLGEAAAWGGGMGATAGFLDSQQFRNFEGGAGFRSNRAVGSEIDRIEDLQKMAFDMDLDLSESYYEKTALNIGSRKLALNNPLARDAVGSRHYFAEYDGNYTELTNPGGFIGFRDGALSNMTADTRLGVQNMTNNTVRSTFVYKRRIEPTARYWQSLNAGDKYSIGYCDCRGYTGFIERTSR